MADDLDWNAIIAPGNDADRRSGAAASTPDAASTPGATPGRRSRTSARHPDDGGASRPAPLSRREARAREAAEARRRGDSGSVADAPVAESAADLHPEVHALLTDTHGTTAAGASDDSDSVAPAGRRAAPGDRTAQRPDGTAERPDGTAERPDGSAQQRDATTARSDGSVQRPDGTGRGDSVGDGGDGAGGHGGGRGGRRDGSGASRPPREPRRKRSRGALIAGIVIVAVVLGAGFGAYQFVAPKVAAIAAKLGGHQESDDWTGSGTAKVTITIKQGDIGEDVAKTLQRSGVVKTSGAFYKLLLASPDIQFQPGSYTLKKHMSAKAALSALQDKKNKTDASIVIPEGTALKDIEAGMVSKAGLSEAQVSAAAANLSAYGLPAGTTTLEGWLFPATYPINPGWSAEDYFKSMVDTMKQHLAAAGVAPADQEHVIVFASLVQKEAGLAADYPKVARVFQNRIDQGMKLQSDATVAYGTGNTHTVTTTDAERADASNKYNTYVHPGLPPAPISNPGDIAIQAVTHPATGNWVYFVTVNLETGETVFSDTYAEHQVAVAQFQSWLRAHPSYQ